MKINSFLLLVTLVLCVGATSALAQEKIQTMISYQSSDHTVIKPKEGAYFGENVTYKAEESSFDEETSSGIMVFDDVVTCIGDEAFFECIKLYEITIPSSVTSIGMCAFNGCENLKYITIPGNVKTIGSKAFEGCKYLSDITIENGVTTIGDGAFYGCNLSSVTIPGSVTSIGDGAFYGCGNLSYVTIENGVTTIGEEAFYGCNLSSVAIPGSVESIGDWAFSECENLTSVTIENGVTSIGSNAFDGCENLSSVTIGNGVTTIGEGAFYGCKLSSVAIPGSVESIGYEAFSGCGNLSDITLNSIPSFDDDVFLDTPDGKTISLNLTDNSYVAADKGEFPSLTSAPKYTRTMANQWGTIVLPFDVTISDQNPYDFYEISSVSGDVLTLSKITGTLSAGTPALIRIYSNEVNGKTYELNITAANCTVNTSGDLSQSANGLSLVGAYDYKDITAKNGYIISNNAFWNIQEVKGENNVYCAPFRAYIAGTTSSSRLRIGTVDESTGIAALDALNSADAEYYDINGRKQDGLKNGVNIIKKGDKTMKVILR